MCRPLDEGNLDDDLRPHPVRANPGQPDRFRERCRGNLQRVEALAEVEQKPGIEARADLARKDEVVIVVVADEQGAEALASALWIGKAADDELLRRLAL